MYNKQKLKGWEEIIRILAGKDDGKGSTKQSNYSSTSNQISGAIR